MTTPNKYFILPMIGQEVVHLTWDTIEAGWIGMPSWVLSSVYSKNEAIADHIIRNQDEYGKELSEKLLESHGLIKWWLQMMIDDTLRKERENVHP